MKNPYYILILLIIVFSCQPSKDNPQEKNLQNPLEDISRPYCRYWWFASEIQEEDVRYNLDWLKENGFGGVEIAWVYPLNRRDKTDSSYTPRQEWLGSEWQGIVEYALKYADSLGLGCDMTFGTLWPFGDSKVPFERATMRFGDSSWRQEITASWEYPQKGYVVDHLNPESYLAYFQRLMDSFPHPELSLNQSYFIDSWEVETKHLWTKSFADDFLKKYGYDISPFMDSIYDKGNSDYLYDYMKLVSEKVIQFYSDFDSTLNDNRILSRGQCSGAPCDIISAYARLDIPEGEALLYEPEFNSIPASAAALSGKKIISAETFTCLYGWPGDYIREEQTADLKLLADALFANGINHIIWHGKPHNPANSDSVGFYASVHVGPDGSLSNEIPAFNSYLEKVSSIMKKGHTYPGIMVYLPVEDAWMDGVMPVERQFIWAWGFYEMRYVYFPEELKGRHPVWINREFLEKGTVRDGVFEIGELSFNSLYIDVEYLDFEALETIFTLAKSGLDIVIKQIPSEPGVKKHEDYGIIVSKLLEMDYVAREFDIREPALVEGDSIPPFWCREDGETLYIFFSNPKSNRLTFPLEYGQSFCENTVTIPVKINHRGETIDLELKFKPYQSLLYKIESGKAEKGDISFFPKTPQVKERPADYKAPWLVE